MKESELQFFAPTPRQRELQILLEIDRDPQVSQKELALRVGLAPSMVNNYMKQLCDEQKVIKQGPNHKRISYHLTESGRKIKNDLLSGYLMEGLRLYSCLSEDLKQRLRRIQQDGIARVVLVGSAGSCQALESVAREVGLEVVGICNGASGMQPMRAVVNGEAQSPPYDRAQAVLLADHTDGPESAQAAHRGQGSGLPVYRV